MQSIYHEHFILEHSDKFNLNYSKASKFDAVLVTWASSHIALKKGMSELLNRTLKIL